MAKFQDHHEVEMPWPPLGRAGVASRQTPDVYTSKLSRLGNLRMRTGNWTAAPARTKPKDLPLFGAEDFLRRAAGGCAHELGAVHPRTLYALVDVGMAAMAQGRPEEATLFLRRAHVGFTDGFGPCHPETISLATSLASALEVQLEKIGEARVAFGDSTTFQWPAATFVPRPEMAQEALILRRSTALALAEQKGESHPDTLAAVAALARLLNANVPQAGHELGQYDAPTSSGKLTELGVPAIDKSGEGRPHHPGRVTNAVENH